MQKNHFDLYIFIDALGWEILKTRSFLDEELPYRFPVKMQFGYSATAIPTILTGASPVEHKHLSFYYYAPDKSPFKIFKYYPSFVMPKLLNHWRFRHFISKFFKKLYGYTGYFELYSMPFEKLRFFDYIEKKDMFVPGGLSPVKNLADVLEENGVSYHISNWRLSESENISALKHAIQNDNISFAFLYTAAMDSLLHSVTKSSKDVDEKIKWYESEILKIIDEIKKKYDTYTVNIISDHGMTTCIGVVDIIKIISETGLKFGKDYCAVYDSTMARFWFLNDKSENIILAKLDSIDNGHTLTVDEKVRFKINFDDNMYGDCIFLLDPGYQFEPCDMGVKALPAMHGYTPDDPDSDACFLSNVMPETKPAWVGDFFKIMHNSITHLREE